MSYFELLDNVLCPADPKLQPVPCGHSFSNSNSILRELGIELTDLQAVFGYLRGQGAHCDREVLTKVAGESRFKTMCGAAQK